MRMDLLDQKELQKINLQLEQAIYGHKQWLNNIGPRCKYYQR